MKRAVTALLGTWIALIFLFAYKPGKGPVLAPAVAPSSDPTSTPAPAPSGGNTGNPTPSASPLTFTGGDVSTPYGDVQVKIVVSGGQLTDVQALQLPSERARSQALSDYAGPQLRSEAIQAQSGQIDVVSGATYTSQAYIQSLSDALGQAHLS